jgi:hypothetical protein
MGSPSPLSAPAGGPSANLSAGRKAKPFNSVLIFSVVCFTKYSYFLELKLKKNYFVI